MKKILFLVLIALAFVSCADPNTNDDLTQLDNYFSGVTTDGGKFTIIASQTAIVYAQSSASGAESFTFTLTKIGTGDTATYRAEGTMGRTAEKYTNTMWDTLYITTDVNTTGFEIRNPTATTNDVDGQYTFTIIGDYESPITELTTNTTSIEAVFKGSSGDVSYQLSEKFIAAIKNYF